MYFFSVAQFASSAISGLVQGYMIFFYTVCVGIPAVQVGTMFLIAKILAGLKDFVLMFLLVFFGLSQALPFLNQHQPIQSDFTKLGMFAIYTIIPASLNLVSIVPILFYRLSGKRMAEIHKRLEEKRAVRETKNSEANIGDIEVQSQIDTCNS